MPKFSLSSDLDVPGHGVLVTLTMEGVNAELRPLVKMAAPAEWDCLPIFDWPVQQHLFKSWVLFMGVFPIDRHSFYFESIRPESGFKERSSSTMNSVWCHERSVTAIRTGCRVTDSIDYQSRLPLIDYLFRLVYRLVSLCRHRNLRSKYGASGR
jgi:hypothetical protein